MLGKIERFSNWLCDMDWGWWPLLSWRPAKNRLMTHLLVVKLTATFGSVAGVLSFLFIFCMHYLFSWPLSWQILLVGSMVYGWISFFLLFESSIFFLEPQGPTASKDRKVKL